MLYSSYAEKEWGYMRSEHFYNISVSFSTAFIYTQISRPTWEMLFLLAPKQKQSQLYCVDR
jgi:hypothetical protein